MLSPRLPRLALSASGPNIGPRLFAVELRVSPTRSHNVDHTPPPHATCKRFRAGWEDDDCVHVFLVQLKFNLGSVLDLSGVWGNNGSTASMQGERAP